MEELVENKSYEYQKKIFVFIGKVKNRAEFLGYHSENGNEIMIKTSIPIKGISLEGNLLKTEGGNFKISYFYNQNWLGNKKEEFQELLNQYTNALS